MQGLNQEGVPVIRRRVSGSAYMYLTDDETLGANEHADANQEMIAVVTSDMPQDILHMEKGAGGEVRVELDLVVQALITGDVRVNGKARLYEGTSEATTDLDGEENISFIVPRDDYISRKYTVMNTAENGGDSGEISLTLNNSAV